MIRCAITSGHPARPREAWLADARRWAEAGLEYVQLREKWMEAEDLAGLAADLMGTFRDHGGGTKLLVNGRADVAVAAGADGVHLTSHPDELTPRQVRGVFAVGGRGTVISVSCHTLEEARRAREAGADLILFGPVFEKRVQGEVVVAGVGFEVLREACGVARSTPVLALGGITEEHVERCLQAGAAGVAGIRLFA